MKDILGLLKYEYVWEFLYNPFTYESSSMTVSIHKTKKGAMKALEKHKESVKLRHEKDLKKGGASQSGYDWAKYWGVKKTRIFE